MYYDPKKYIYIRTLTYQNANYFLLLMKSEPLILWPILQDANTRVELSQNIDVESRVKIWKTKSNWHTFRVEIVTVQNIPCIL